MEPTTVKRTYFTHLYEDEAPITSTRGIEDEAGQPTIEKAREFMLAVQEHIDEASTAYLVRVEVICKVTIVDPNPYHLIPHD